MINIIDRLVATPHRYLLTLVSGSTYDITPIPGAVTDEGTVVNRSLLMGLQGFVANETVFNEDGSITETNADSDEKVTTFNLDGSITEVFTSGTMVITKTTTFNANGSISEVMI